MITWATLELNTTAKNVEAIMAIFLKMDRNQQGKDTAIMEFVYYLRKKFNFHISSIIFHYPQKPLILILTPFHVVSLNPMCSALCSTYYGTWSELF